MQLVLDDKTMLAGVWMNAIGLWNEYRIFQALVLAIQKAAEMMSISKDTKEFIIKNKI